MIDADTAATEIRRLSRLKGYPRSWDQTAGSAAAEQDAQAEAAIIDAAAEAPSVSRLRQFINDWERQHVEAPMPATLYAAWRDRKGYQGTVRRQKCEACGDSGWVTRHYVTAAMLGDRERIEIGEAEVDDWWQRIRATATCAQRVYGEAVRCGCGSAAGEVRPDQEADSAAYRREDSRMRQAGER